jgi:7-carboxy-7-deazaguanine synthase
VGTETLPLAPQGVFLTFQGEGVMMGEPMAFVRLAGCSVGCPGCDTDYSVASRATPRDIARMAVEAAPGVRWAWVTGGEPTDHDGLTPLVEELRRAGFYVALATSGIRPVTMGRKPGAGGVDFLSVSPHDPARWVQRWGCQLNLVFGLNGLTPESVEPHLSGMHPATFPHCYATPCDGRPETLAVCVEFVRRHPGFRLGAQAHKQWRLA